MDLTLHISTCQEPDSGRAGFGVVMQDASSARVIHEGGYPAEDDRDARVAEWEALLTGLELIAPLGAEQVLIECGSQRMVNQVTGLEPAAEPIEPLLERAMMALLTLDTWRMAVADSPNRRRATQLARAAMEEGARVVELDPQQAAERQKRSHTGVPQWTVELAEDPGPDCPARCRMGVKYAFGPDTPPGFCVHATGVALLDGPMNWPDPEQKRMTSQCPYCDVPLDIVKVGD